MTAPIMTEDVSYAYAVMALVHLLAVAVLLRYRSMTSTLLLLPAAAAADITAAVPITATPALLVVFKDASIDEVKAFEMLQLMR
jgi:hypothetical protein